MIEQPPGQRCANLGGIMAARMKVLGVKGVVVSGRVRDLTELKQSGLQVRNVTRAHHGDKTFLNAK